jgi:hypothetical protein
MKRHTLLLSTVSPSSYLKTPNSSSKLDVEIASALLEAADEPSLVAVRAATCDKEEHDAENDQKYVNDGDCD